jgi:branched-chain amino acid transport system permease protein
MDYKFTGGDRGLTTTPFFGTLEPLPYYYLLLALAVLAIILISLVMRSKIGYFLRAIRNDQIAAQTMGINIVRWKIFSFMLSSGIAGIAGAFYAHSVGLVSPVLGEFNEMAMIIILVVTGGIRSQSGPVIGALTVRFFAEILREWAEVRMLILSALVILIMRFFHGGIVGFFNRCFRRMQRKSTFQGNLK